MKTMKRSTRFFLCLMGALFIYQVFVPSFMSERVMASVKASKTLLIGTWKMSDGTAWNFDSKGKLTLTEPGATPLMMNYQVASQAKKPNALTITLLNDSKTKNSSINAVFSSSNVMLLDGEKLTRVIKKATPAKFSLTGFQLVFNFITGTWKGANGIIIEPDKSADNSIESLLITGDPNNLEGGAMAFNYTYDTAMKAGNTFKLNLENVNYEYIVTGIYTDERNLTLTLMERRSGQAVFKNVKFTRVPKAK